MKTVTLIESFYGEVSIINHGKPIEFKSIKKAREWALENDSKIAIEHLFGTKSFRKRTHDGIQ